MDIKDKVVLVTGANRGIGKAITEALITKGVAKLYAAVRDPASAQALVGAFGDKIVPLEIDLSKPETITAAASAAPDVDIVVNNAGVLTETNPFAENLIESLSYEMEINVHGLVRMAQAFAPILKTNGGGAFVQLNSVASFLSFAGFSTYCASKAAAYSMTQALRSTLMEQGTLVISVHPGPIATDMADTAGLTEIAEPASLVGDSLVDALEKEYFHAFPDTMAKQLGAAYASFAENVIEAPPVED